MLALAFVYSPSVTEEYALEAGVRAPGQNMTLGMAGGTDPIQFGVLPPEGVSSQRTVRLSNEGGSTVRIALSVEGNISDHVRVADGMMLEPGENRNVTLEFRPEGASPGYYSGSLVVTRQRVR